MKCADCGAPRPYSAEAVLGALLTGIGSGLLLAFARSQLGGDTLPRWWLAAIVITLLVVGIGLLTDPEARRRCDHGDRARDLSSGRPAPAPGPLAAPPTAPPGAATAGVAASPVAVMERPRVRYSTLLDEFQSDLPSTEYQCARCGHLGPSAVSLGRCPECDTPVDLTPKQVVLKTLPEERHGL